MFRKDGPPDRRSSQDFDDLGDGLGFLKIHSTKNQATLKDKFHADCINRWFLGCQLGFAKLYCRTHDCHKRMSTPRRHYHDVPHDVPQDGRRLLAQQAEQRCFCWKLIL